MVSGSRGTVFLSGMPSAAAGPVVDKEIPTLISAIAGRPQAAMEAATAVAANLMRVLMKSPKIIFRFVAGVTAFGSSKASCLLDIVAWRGYATPSHIRSRQNV